MSARNFVSVAAYKSASFALLYALPNCHSERVPNGVPKEETRTARNPYEDVFHITSFGISMDYQL